jgi:ADP-heptose:LPS heptosyltransferase
MKIETKPKILVRRRASIGDVIMTTPIVRELHKKYNGECEISVITECVQVFANNPYVKHVYHTTRPIGGMIWDVEYNLDNAYEINPKNHFVDSYFFRVFGDTNYDKTVELYPAPHDYSMIQELLPTLGEKFVVMHMRRWAWENKNIHPEIWRDIIDGLILKDKDLKLVVVGSGPDYNVKDHPRVISLHGELTLQQTKVLFEHASAFIGTDSAPFAIAGSTDVPIVGLLTHLLPERIVPFRPSAKTIPIMSLADCVGCYDNQTRPVSSVQCIHGDYRCNSMFSVSAIVDATIAAMKK